LQQCAEATWAGLDAPSVNKVANALGVCWHTARDCLVRAGKYTSAGA
jgi:hypothetical protein